MCTLVLTYDLSKLTQKNINNLNRSVSGNEIEAIIIFNQRKVKEQMY
jgi:hypothetical protein